MLCSVAYSYFKDTLILKKISHSEFLCWFDEVHFLTVLWFTGWLRRSINNNTGWAQGSYWTGVMGDWLWERTSSRCIHQHSKICTMDRQGHGLSNKLQKKFWNWSLNQYENNYVPSARVNFAYTHTKVCAVWPTGMCHLDRTLLHVLQIFQSFYLIFECLLC